MIAGSLFAADRVDDLLARIADPGQRYPAIIELGKMGAEAKPAVPALKEILRSEDWIGRRDAALAIGQIDPADHESFLLVKGLLDKMGVGGSDPDIQRDDVAAACVSGIGEFTPLIAEALPILIQALGDPRLGVDLAAQDRLIKIDALAVPALIDALDNPREARGAAYVLSYLSWHSLSKEKVAQEFAARQSKLIRTLSSSEDDDVRQDVASALRLVHTPEALEALKQSRGKDDRLRQEFRAKEEEKRQRRYESIQNVDFGEVLRAGCEKPAYIEDLVFGALVPDRGEQAVLLASTCYTGNAGPDVHAVYTLDSERRLDELNVEQPPKKNLDTLFGAWNYRLGVKSDSLIARYTDSSGREDALTVRYRWDGKRFAVAAITQDGPYETSYDCAKAVTEVERAICYVQPLADLDRRLAGTYRGALKASDGAGREALKREQLQWLKKRETRCAIYKMWVECLSRMYEERIQALGSRDP